MLATTDKVFGRYRRRCGSSMPSVTQLGQSGMTMKMLRKDRRLPLESDIINIIVIVIIDCISLGLEIRWTFVFMRILILILKSADVLGSSIYWAQGVEHT